MSENHNSTDKDITMQPGFSLESAKVHYLSESVVETGFLPEEIRAIREAIFPHGGSLYTYDVTFDGIKGQRIEIHTPLTGTRTGNHLLSLIKTAVSDTQYDYAAQPFYTDEVLPINDFGQALKTTQDILKTTAKAKPAVYHHSHNG